MKKILVIFIILFNISSNLAFAELSENTQTKYKTQIDNVLNKFENKLSNYSNDDKINKFNTIIQKIDKISSNKLSEKNTFVLAYLKQILNEKINKYKTTNNTLDTDNINQNQTNNQELKTTNTSTGTKYNTEVVDLEKNGQTQSSTTDTSLSSKYDIAKYDNAYFESLSEKEKQKFFTTVHPEYILITTKGILSGAKESNTAAIDLIKAGPNSSNNLYYDQYIHDYNLGISYYRDGGLLDKDGNINQEAAKFLKSSSYNKYFTNPSAILNGKKVEDFNSTLKKFGYYVDTTTWKVKYDSSKNQYKDNSDIFPYIKGTFETGFTTY